MLLALPANYSLLEVLYLFAGYYAGHVAVLFFTLGVYGGSLHRKSIRKGQIFISLFLAFLLGMQGSRGMLVIYGPLAAVEMVRCFHQVFLQRIKGSAIGKKSVRETDWKISVWVLAGCVVNYLGNCLPVSVSFGFSRNIRKGFSKLLETVIPDAAEAMGFGKVGTFGQICLMFLFINAGYVLVKVLYKILKRKEPEVLEWIYLVVCASPIMTVLMVSFTTVESTGRYYFTFLIMLSMAVVIVIKEKSLVTVKACIWIAVSYLAVANIVNLYLPMIGSKEPPESDFFMVADYLEENGYLLAYATFENANSMTVVSNGKVKVAPVASMERMDICKWLSSTKWYPPEISRDQVTAYLVTESEMPEFQLFLEGKDSLVEEAEQIGKFHIYVSDYNLVNFQDDSSVDLKS